MRKATFFVLLVFGLFFAGCTQPETTELPDDFEVVYGTGAMHLEWGSYEFRADVSGEASFKKEKDRGLRKTYEFSVSQEELLEIYEAVVANDFFLLLDSYEDPFIIDGGWSQISISANGSEKTVTLMNIDNAQFGAVERKINELIFLKAGENAFSFNDLIEECGAKELECKEAEKAECAEGDLECEAISYECDEWKNFCGWEESAEFSVEYCSFFVNRSACIDHCSETLCETELCEELLFELSGCTECASGCCSFCTDLHSCSTTEGCQETWILPLDEWWQFGGCNNFDFCANQETLCADLDLSISGYEQHAASEEDAEKAAYYNSIIKGLGEIFELDCQDFS